MSLAVSCIIPTYEMGHYVADAICSVLAQTRPAAEIIVVDDGSSDDTAEVLAQFGTEIRVLSQPNRGVSVARNTGLAAASGDLIAFLDADDVLLPDRFARQIPLFEETRALMFCDAATEYFFSPEMTPADLAADHRYDHSFWKTPVAGHISTWLMRRALMELVGPFEPGCAFSEDTDWMLRCEESGVERARQDITVSQRRLHATNTTRQDRRAQAAGLLNAIHRKRSR